MGLYEELCENDVLGPIAGELERGRFKLELDGTIEVKRGLNLVQPWLNSWMDNDRLCGLWLGVYFNYYRFIPKMCRKCWKIVWTGDKLEQLMRIREIQLEMAHGSSPVLASKCGVETRPASGKLAKYQGFWYAQLKHGLDGAREAYKCILERLMRDPIIAPVELILKRGCTEMEHQWSPSDKWDEYAKNYGWDRDEALCDTVFRPMFKFGVEPTVFQTHIVKKWIEHAVAHGDPTAKKFMDTNLLKGVLRYEKSYHSGKDYTGLEVGEGGRASDCEEERKVLDVRGSSNECRIQGSKLTIIH